MSHAIKKARQALSRFCQSLAQIVVSIQPEFASDIAPAFVHLHDNWQGDNPWETVAKPKDLWE